MVSLWKNTARNEDSFNVAEHLAYGTVRIDTPTGGTRREVRPRHKWWNLVIALFRGIFDRAAIYRLHENAISGLHQVCINILWHVAIVFVNLKWYCIWITIDVAIVNPIACDNCRCCSRMRARTAAATSPPPSTAAAFTAACRS